eukprot:2815421-Pleurochrysis_carterae.AAC.1
MAPPPYIALAVVPAVMSPLARLLRRRVCPRRCRCRWQRCVQRRVSVHALAVVDVVVDDERCVD